MSSVPLQVGRRYKRKVTHLRLPEVVGKEQVIYLVQAPGSKQLVSCWLNKVMDPDAPHEIWVQDTDRIAGRARQLSEQRSPIHVFLKESKREKDSEYLGQFRAAELWTRDTHSREITERERSLEGTEGERPLRHVLIMEPADL